MQLLALNNLFFLAIIPIIILLYLLKRKYENYQVSSNLLWDLTLRDLEAVKPWQKLKRSILLLLQLLIAILLIIALLRPAISTEGVIANQTIVVIDSSASMLAMEEDKNRFDLAIAEAKKIIDSKGGTQTITLIELSATPKIVVSKSFDKEVLQNALDSITVRYGTGDEIGAFSLAKSIASIDNESGIIWISDGSNSKLNSLKQSLAKTVKFKHIQVGKTRQNLTVSTFVTEENNNKIRGLIRVDNNGSATKRADLAIEDIDGNLINSYNISVKGNDIYTIELSELPTSEAYKAVLTVENDGILEDNQLWSVPFANSEINVTLVSEEGNYFLNHALKLNNITVDKMDELPTTLNQGTDLWIFDRLLPDELPAGNALIIAPKKSMDWLEYNGEKDVDKALEVMNQEHSILNYVSFDNVHVNSFSSLANIQGLETLVKTGDDPILLAGTYKGKRIVILTFDIQNSDFPLNTSFPILIQNTIDWLTPKQSVPIIAVAPEEIVSIPLTIGASDRWLLTPSNEKIPLKSDGLIASVTVPEEIGLYKVVEKFSNNETTRYFSVNINENETNVIPTNIAINYDSSGDESSNQDTDFFAYKELMKLFVILALLICFIEWVVYQRGY